MSDYRILFGESELVARWISAQIRDAPELAGAVAFGAVRGDLLVGGIAFTEHRGTDVRVTVAGYGAWMTRRLLRTACAYAFLDLGCRRMTAIIKRTNRPSRDLCERIGFAHEGTHPQTFDDAGTALSYGMTRAACRWLKGADLGKEDAEGPRPRGDDRRPAGRQPGGHHRKRARQRRRPVQPLGLDDLSAPG